MSSTALDLTSVERRGQATAVREPVVKKNRPHGLEDAPTYYPTEEDWRDPFEYMRKISEEASKFGICKIVPPESWNPDFAIDTEVHFSSHQAFSSPHFGRFLAESTQPSSFSYSNANHLCRNFISEPGSRN